MPKILILAETDEGQLKLATLSAVAFAEKLVADAGGSFEILVVGHSVGPVAEQLRAYGAASVLAADHPQLERPLADKYAHVVAQVAKERGTTIIAAAASTFSKDILPRAAG